MPKAIAHRLVIFLLKDTLAAPEDALVKSTTTHQRVSCGGVTGDLYYRQAVPHAPSWAKFFAWQATPP